MTTKLYHFYYFCFLIIVFLPLFGFQPWFYPSAWGKTIIFRSILAVVLLIFLSKQKLKLKELKKITPLVFLFVFFFFTFLSLFNSPNLTFSLLGNPQRAGGLINYVFYFLFALLCFLILKQREWQKLFQFFLLTGFLTGLFALFQQYFLKTGLADGRASGTLGNPTFLALFLTPLVFLALYYFFQEKKYLYLLTSLYFIFIIIFITQTRAALVGLGVGFIWLSLFQGKKIKMGLIIFLLLVASFFYFFQAPQSIERLTSIRGGENRLSVWKISSQAFLEKPLLGYGPENFYIAFNKYYDTSLPGMEREKWFDKAHNNLINVLIEYGLFALIFFLLFFLSLLYYLYKKKTLESLFIQTALLGYLATSFFSIQTFSTLLLLFFLIAYSLYLIYGEKEYIKQKKNKYALLLIIPLIWFLLGYNFNVLGQNLRLNQARTLLGKDPQKAFQIIEQEKQKNTFLTHYLNTQYEDLLKVQDPQKSTELLKENIKLKPYQVKNWILLGRNLLLIKDKEGAQQALEQARKLKPRDPDIILELTMVDLDLGEQEKAFQRIDFCFSEFNNLKHCYWARGLVNLRLDNLEIGEKNIEKAKELNYPSEKKIPLRQLIWAYSQNNHYEKLITLHERLIEIEPEDPRHLFALAEDYKQIGEKEKAKEIVLLVLEEFPDFKPFVDDFLENL